MAHGQWTEVEARGVLDACRKSGLTIEQFARKRGLVPQRLYWWRKKLANAEAARSPTVLSVKLIEPRRGEPVTVLLRTGHMLKVGRDFDEAVFARVVALLEAG